MLSLPQCEAYIVRLDIPHGLPKVPNTIKWPPLFDMMPYSNWNSRTGSIRNVMARYYSSIEGTAHVRSPMINGGVLPSVSNCPTRARSSRRISSVSPTSARGISQQKSTGAVNPDIGGSSLVPWHCIQTLETSPAVLTDAINEKMGVLCGKFGGNAETIIVLAFRSAVR